MSNDDHITIIFTGNDAGAIVEQLADERGGRQRGVRHEQADGVRDQVARVDGDAELGQHGVYEQRGGQENRADHEVGAVQYLPELQRAGGVRHAGGQSAGEHHARVRRIRLGLHRVHAVVVALDGQQAAVHQHAAVRQQPVSRLQLFRGRDAGIFHVSAEQVPAAGTAVRRLQAVEIEVLTWGRDISALHTLRTYIYGRDRFPPKMRYLSTGFSAVRFPLNK